MINYGVNWSDVSKYPKLIRLYRNSAYDPKKQQTLDLTEQKLTDIISQKLLSIYCNIQLLDISRNQIVRFDSESILRCCPKIERIILDHNKIEDLEDFNHLGKLKRLSNLSLLNNPVGDRKSGLTLLQDLIFPPSAKKYSPVEILTATYTLVPNKREVIQNTVLNKAELIYDLEVLESGQMKHEKGKGVSTVPRLHSQDEKLLAYLTDRPCPERKVGLFRLLEVLNGSRISLLDIFIVINGETLKDIKAVIVEEGDFTHLANKKLAEERKARKREKNEDLSVQNKHYLRKYEKKMKRIEEQFEPKLYLTESETPKDADYLQIVYKIDRINNDRGNMKALRDQKLGIFKPPNDMKDEEQIPMDDLAKEGIKLLKAKEQKRLREEQERKEYNEKLRKVYKFKKYKDEPKYEKLFENQSIDPKELEQ